MVATNNGDDPDIGDLLANASGLDLDAQAIAWDRTRWEPIWEQHAGLSGQDVLDEIGQEVERHGTIRGIEPATVEYVLFDYGSRRRKRN